MEAREVLKKALQDPKLKIEAIIPREYHKIGKALKKESDDVVISEWLHTLGSSEYEYHVHKGQIKIELGELYEKGMGG